MQMPQTGDGHRKLEQLVGTWVGEETLHPSLWDAEGGPAEGRAENRIGLDGFAVIHDYEQRRGGKVNFLGHGVFRYDEAEACYMLTWFDCLGSSPQTFRGDFEGSVLRLESPMPGGRARATWDFSEPDQYRYRMEVSGDGQQWKPFTEGTYRRR